MPDKESTPTPYMRLGEVDFLKRRNVYVSELECNVGALDENSIFKSLHCIRSDTIPSQEEVVIQNIDGALREWFFHGKEKFQLRQLQMLEIHRLIGYPVHEANLSFDDRVRQWKEKYRDNPYPNTEITEH